MAGAILARRAVWLALIVATTLAWSPARADQAAIGDETVRLASLRVGDPNDVALPRILSHTDAVLYARVFALQEDGRWPEADRLIGRIENRILLGHVLAQRYLHPTKYRTSFDELAAWLEDYGDHPGGHRIHRLAMARQPFGAPELALPSAGSFGLEIEDISPPIAAIEDDGLSGAEQKRVQKLLNKIRRSIAGGDPAGAYAVLKTAEFKRLASDEAYDRAAQAVAFLYFLKGKAQRALEIASKAAARSGAKAPLTHWTAGLAAFELGRMDTARVHFAKQAASPAASSRQRAAGAYWAARAAQATGRIDEANGHLQIAASYPTTFYGLLARESLGQSLGLDWNVPELSPRERDELLGYPEVRRALALVQVGQRRLAEQEFSSLDARRDPGRALAVLGLASRIGLPATEIRLAYGLADGWDARYHASLYPVPLYRPRDGFQIDRALLFAFMRQESAFNPFAKSSAGATGLMQLMPATAAYIGQDSSLGDKKDTRLLDPEFNLALGQRYMAHLMVEPTIGTNLVYLAAAYNAGPGNLKKWLNGPAGTKDPLLFLESMPSAETRHFVQQVLANFWLYRARLNQDSPSLRQVAQGRWPSYDVQDTRQLAAHAGN
ncbi:MAG: lytic transglycosylase domain-containing protein [Alphaproteobacteria bacterium]